MSETQKLGYSHARFSGRAKVTRQLTWIHLSDFHLCQPKTGWDATRIVGKLLLDVQATCKEHGLEPSFIFVTGDLAYGSIPEYPDWPLARQYEEAAQLLHQLREATGVRLGNTCLVPGNHDVNRSRAEPADAAWLDALEPNARSTETVSEAMRQYGKGPQFMTRLDEYRTFLSGSGYAHLLPEGTAECCFYHLTRTVAGDVTVGIAGANTAWSSCRDAEKGKIWLGLYQLYHLYEALESCHLRILLTHHPFGWLNQLEDPLCRAYSPRMFQFHLHGHEHYLAPTYVEGQYQIPSGACYAEAPVRRSVREETGYSIGSLNLDSGSFRAYLRQYNDSGDGGWVPMVVPGKAGDGVWRPGQRVKFGRTADIYPVSVGTHREEARVVSGIGLTSWLAVDTGDTGWMGVSDFEPEGMLVRTLYGDTRNKLPGPCRAIYRQHIRSKAAADARGENYPFNGARYRILSLAVHGREVADERVSACITFGPSDYYSFLSTSRELDQIFRWRDGTKQSLRARYLTHLREQPDKVVPLLAHSFGLNILVVTRDNVAVITQRSGKLALRRGLFHISVNEGLRRSDGGKLFDQASPEDATPCIERAGVRGMWEELALRLDPQTSTLRWTSLALDPVGYQYCLLGYVRVPQSWEEVLHPAEHARDRRLEVKDIHGLDFEPKAACRFVMEHGGWVAWGVECLFQALAAEEHARTGHWTDTEEAFRLLRREGTL